ncbi:glycosyltransferase family 4 protein [Bradyrhizobium liaoningense]|uniref:glycosyltransferase family 4 protein n=1 Tax=Bradyrhizobium liaoningense TaxID=43992 RepID=UPI001BA95EE5|nr:glycosyltransferase family 4 protein [Bradyrhizobium liaoningense]MBR0737664.1 glycosyltransferase family 4 protein [Bradyrhizobium liaoningense]
MIEVCFVTKTWRAGAAWVTQMTAQAIAEQGASVAMIAPLAEPSTREPRHPNLVRILVGRELTEGGTGLTRALASLRRVVGTWWAVCRMRARTRTYVFSIPDPLIFTLPLLILLRLSGARVIFLVHDAVPHAFRFGGVLRSVELAAHKLSYHLANLLVVMTRALRDELVEKLGFSSAKIVVVPHGAFKIEPVAPCPGSGRLFMFGTFRRNKSVLEAIKAVILVRRSDPGVSLVLAGEPHPHELDYWQECQGAMLMDPTAFDVKVGFLPDEELPARIANVDAFLLAYRDFNSQSGVGVLAGLAGRPVIGTRAGGLSELFDDGLSGIQIEGPPSPESIARAIQAFRVQPIDHWRHLASNAALKLEAVLSWNAISMRYLGFVRRGRG